ncbi:MAG: M20/M25/M40 family metallo-hydrolase [Oligoflexia bacterium]|nr:M20/M25/M40 family metallo-hydrolase [Oligoflexia bacterium]
MNSTVKTLTAIFNEPTAPFREFFVLNTIEKILRQNHIPYFKDSLGQIIAGVTHARQLRNRGKIVLMAHTDHPGFHLIKRQNLGFWTAQWHGGRPPKSEKAFVRIFDPDRPHWSTRAQIAKINKKHVLTLKLLEKSSKLNNRCFGAFDYPGAKINSNLVTTRAADDLSGVVIILEVLKALKNRGSHQIVGVFTRAEEVGFRGAIHLFNKIKFHRDSWVLSLEASRQLPGARPGKGCVIRLGDKRSLYDSEIIRQLDQCAKSISKKNFKFQRRLMDGGTCEATAARAFGLKAAGLAVPLKNYHNQRANGHPGPEGIDLRDVNSAVILLKQLTRFYDTETLTRLQTDLLKGFRKHQPLLKQKFGYRQ